MPGRPERRRVRGAMTTRLASSRSPRRTGVNRSMVGATLLSAATIPGTSRMRRSSRWTRPVQQGRGNGSGARRPGGAPALLVQSLEPVEEQIERELELELVVATGADHRLLVVGPVGGDGDDVREQRGQLLRHGGQFVRVADVPVLVQLLGEAEDTAAQRVHDVVGEIYRQGAAVEDTYWRGQVAYHDRLRGDLGLHGAAGPRMPEQRPASRQDPLPD